MRRVAAWVLVFTVLICLVSCTLSEDGGSSVPVLNVQNSSEESLWGSGIPSEDSSVSDRTDSTSEESGETPSNTASESGHSSEQNVSVTVSSLPTSSQTGSPPTGGSSPSAVKREQYYGYSKLEPDLRQAYDKLMAAVGKMQMTYIDLGDADVISETDAYLVTIALKNDNPQIFWLPYSWYIGETHNGQMAILFVNSLDQTVGDSIEDYQGTYTVEKAKKSDMERELKAAVSEIKSMVTATDPYGIELQLHDILCQRISYSETPSPNSYTAYGALVEGNAVCEGYTRAMQLMLYEFGINSTPVTGYALQPHMWNMVQLGSDWYHLDLTWNDNSTVLRHTYFNLTDFEIKKDHTISPDYKTLTKEAIFAGSSFNFSLEECRSEEYYYFARTGYIYKNDPAALAERIIALNGADIEVIGWQDGANAEIDAILSKRNHALPRYKVSGNWAKIESFSEG